MAPSQDRNLEGSPKSRFYRGSSTDSMVDHDRLTDLRVSPEPTNASSTTGISHGPTFAEVELN